MTGSGTGISGGTLRARPSLTLSKLSLTSFMLFAGLGTFYPMLPMYLSQAGKSASAIATYFAAITLTSILSLQLWGYLADVLVGRRKVLVLATLGSAVSLLGVWLLAAPLGAHVVGLIVWSLFSSARFQIWNTVVLERPGGEQDYGKVRVAGSWGFAAGLLTGALLADRLPIAVEVIFPVAVCCELVSSLFLLRVRDARPVRAPVSAAPSVPKPTFSQVQRRLLSVPALPWLLLFCFLSQVPHQTGQILQGKLLADLQAPAMAVAWAFILGVLGESIPFLLGKQVLSRFPIALLLASGAVAQFIRWALIAAFPTPEVIVATNLLHLFTFGVSYLAVVIYANRETPHEIRSSAQTLIGIFYSSLSALVGNLLTAWLLAHADMRVFYLSAAVWAAASLLILIPFSRAHRRATALHAEPAR